MARRERTQPAPPPQVTPAEGEYLQALWELVEEGVAPLRARLAERLRVSAPAVTELTRKLAREGLIRAGQALEFTPAGLEAALSVVRRHRLLERLLTDLLGIPWHAAHDEAARLEHHVSHRLEESLAKTLEAEGMRVLDSWGIRPGASLVLLGHGPQGSRVRTPVGVHIVPPSWAFCIRVERAEGPA
jgi:Mn-dependent DtxR family transcriptional regulator